MNPQQMQNMQGGAQPNMGMNMNMGNMNNMNNYNNFNQMHHQQMNHMPQNNMNMNAGGQHMGMGNQNFMNMKKNNNIQGNQTDINDKYKTERCRHFETHKNCALGDKCHFAHGDKELRKPGDPMNPEQTELALKSQQWQNCNQANQPRFSKNRNQNGHSDAGFRGGYGRGDGNGKPGMIKNFNNRGGFQDRRQNGFSKDNKYRTVPCHNFNKGYCKYGDKCTFIHDVNQQMNPMNGMGNGNSNIGMSQNQMPMQPNFMGQPQNNIGMNQYQNQMIGGGHNNQMQFPQQTDQALLMQMMMSQSQMQGMNQSNLPNEMNPQMYQSLMGMFNDKSNQDPQNEPGQGIMQHKVNDLMNPADEEVSSPEAQ